MARSPFNIAQILQGNSIPQMPTSRDFLGSDDPMAGLPTDGPTDLPFSVANDEEPLFEMDEDGTVREVPAEEDEISAAGSADHTANLALTIPEDELLRIGRNIVDLVEEDIDSRSEHFTRFSRGLEMMGVKSDAMDDGPFPGASSVTHPLLAEALVQFWSRALTELVPSEGPAKSKIMGKQTADKIARGQRIETYLNHEILFIDDGWYSEHSRATFAIPFAGDAFKKVYHDPILRRNTSIYVRAEDFIVPFNATDLRTAPRFTHRIWRTPNELRKCQASGFYRKVKLDKPGTEDLPEESTLRLEVQGITANGDDEDARYELYETNIELDLPGHEDPDGIERPYLVTVERESGKVLSIYRGWKEADPLKRRRIQWVQYSYIPGLGFYSLGLFHLIGGLQEAATGALRAILDGSATASLQGGFVAKDANISEERLEVEPGVWKPVNATSEDLAKAFFTPPYKEPSPALANMLQFLVSSAEKFSATTELMTGETNAKAPVGSVMAVIEQASKVFSTIHRGLHTSMAQELRARFELVQEHMPEGGYPYDVDGAHEGLLAEDFAPGVGIQPVSDPNIFSSAQRLALSQATYDLAVQNPDVLRKEVAVRRVLEAMKTPDPDELFIKHDPPPPMDPVSEIQALLRGEPVQAYPDQLHSAYLQHYSAFLQNPGFGGNPQVMQTIGPMLQALVGQRLAYAWATGARALGVPAPILPPPMQGEEQPGGAPGQTMIPPGMGGQPGMPGGAPGAPPVPMSAPPEVVAQMAAQVAPQLAQMPGMPVPQDPAAEAKAKAEDQKSQLAAAEAQQRMRQADELHQQKLTAQQQADALKLRDQEAVVSKKEQEAAKAAEARQIQAQAAQAEQDRANMQLAQDQQQRDQEHMVAVAQAEEQMRQEQEAAAVEAAIQAAQAEHDRELAERQADAQVEATKAKARAQAKQAAKPKVTPKKKA